jgi:Tfp pilus assembly protein PilF
VPRGLRAAYPLIAILLATAAAYLPSIDGEFVFDDPGLLRDPLLRSPFQHGLADWSGPRGLVTFSFALNYLAVGGDTRGWHVTNLCIHLGVVLLAWAFARRTLERAGLPEPSGPALAVAALFALHPLQTESVAYLSQRAESLAAGFYLLAMLLLLLRDESVPSRRRAALLAGAFLAQAAGAWTKPTVATLPIAWLLHAALLPPPGERAGIVRRLRARLLPAAPLFALSIASALRELAAVRGLGHAGFEVPDMTPMTYLAAQLRVVPTYLGLAVWPSGQCADHAFFPRGLGGWRGLAGALILGAVIAFAAKLAAGARGREGVGPAAARTGAFGVLFFFTTLAPSSSLVPLADPIAEHRVYLGLLGLSLAAVAAGTWALRTWLPARGAGLRWLLPVGLCAVLGAATASRASVWSSSETLWEDVVRKAPARARGHLNLGVVRATQGRHREALEEYERAAQWRGDHTVPDAILAARVVDSLTALGRLEEAWQVAQAELDRSRGSSEALGLLARVEYVAGRFDAAEAAAVQARGLNPRNAAALKLLGMIRARRGDWSSAREALGAAASADPSDTMIQWELGRAAEADGDLDAACSAYRRAENEPGLAAMAARAASAVRALGCR